MNMAKEQSLKNYWSSNGEFKSSLYQLLSLLSCVQRRVSWRQMTCVNYKRANSSTGKLVSSKKLPISDQN